MKDDGDLRREIEALRERLSRLSEASLRINERLDLDSVLQGVLDSARTLTGARYALITTLDGSGQAEEFLVSGLTPDEARQLWELPTGKQFFQYLSRLPGPLRVRDFAGHVRSMGLPDFHPPAPVSSFMAAPLRHQGASVGNINVARSEPGQEFTREDEETLVMFASQAALVIANARRHRDELRARSDLETLIDTSPVGVVVFALSTGTPVSFNREALRILEVLRTPGHPVEQLLEVLTIRRADGSEFSLEEFPLARMLATSETVRAEEIVMTAPDGRRITVLINATSIRSERGEVESVIVTLQDMTPLEELERLRAEFLGMVSHELRAPLASIKGSAATLTGSAETLDPAEMLLFFRIIEQQADQMSALITDLLDMARIETGALPVSAEPADPTILVDQARNTFLSGGPGNPVHIDLEPDLPRVLADRRRIVQVLVNLLYNSSRNSPESAGIRVGAMREADHVAFSVADDGRGLSPELIPYLFRKFARFEGDDPEHGAGGSGLGLAICRGIVEAHGGRIRAESAGMGLGARFTFTLPVADGPVGIPRTGSAWTLSPARGENRTRILVVDDDPQTLRYVRDALSSAGYACTVTGDPEQVGILLEREKPHLVLLDLLLPGTDGIGLMERLPMLSRVPVIFLSAYGRDQIIAQALEAGADDYIVKPFSPTELVARIRTVLRRRAVPATAEPAEPFVSGELTIDYGERRVSLSGRSIPLTDKEYRLLYELSVNADRVVPHDHLLQALWGPRHPGHPGPVRTVVKNLRRKLGEGAHNPTHILNEPRIGYRMPRAGTVEE